MPKLAADLQFSQLQALQMRVHNNGTAPSTPVTGQLWYDNTSTPGVLKWWDGTQWVAAMAGAGTPTGPAGGDLTGTYPNPQIAAGVITDADVNALNKDGAAGTASMRTLGPGANQAAPGNDSRFTDSRPPNGSAGGDLTGTYPNPQIGAGVIVDADVAAANKDGAAATPSLRTLGLGAAQAMAGNTRLDQITAPTAAVSLNGQKITNVADNPTAGTDAANKNYVDNTTQGLDAKASVRLATTANIALTGNVAIDGQTSAAGDRILVKNQTTTSENGIYVASAGAWTRATDADAWTELPGAYVWVEIGTANADTGWVCTSDQGGTLGSTAVTWVQFSAAGAAIAGAGLTKTGNTFDVGGTTNRITVAADSVDIAATYVGQTSITTLGTIATGTWNGTDVAVADGGTGASTAPAARTNLVASGYYSALLGAVTAGVAVVVTAATHLLRATRGLVVQLQEESTGTVVLPDITVASNGDVSITCGASQAANFYRVTIVG